MYRTKKGLETNKELPKANVLKNEQAKSALAELKSGFYLEQNVLWDTRMVAFVISFRRSLSIFLWWIKTWAKVCWNGNQCKAHCTLSLEESNHQMIKKLTQHLKHLLRPKEHASTRRHGRIRRAEVWRKGKQNVLHFLSENSRIEKLAIPPEDQNK